MPASPLPIIKQVVFIRGIFSRKSLTAAKVYRRRVAAEYIRLRAKLQYYYRLIGGTGERPQSVKEGAARTDKGGN